MDLRTVSLAVVFGAVSMVACSAPAETEEKKGDTSSAVRAPDPSCFEDARDIADARARLEAMQACADDAFADEGEDVDVDLPDDLDLPSGGNSRSTSISCVNGVCTCGDGPNEGATCDGTTSTGAESCSVLCSF